MVDSGARPDWEAPIELIHVIEKVKLNGKRFTLDAAAEVHNAICQEFLGEAFAKPWPARAKIWCYPPCGRTASRPPYDWLHLGYVAGQRGSKVIYLLPAHTEEGWFHAYVPFANVDLLLGHLTSTTSKAWTDPKTGKVYAPVSDPDPVSFSSCLFTFPGTGKIQTWDWRRHL